MSDFSIKQNGGPMNASAIKLSKVSKRYGKRHVLHDVSFEVHQSELCALVGQTVRAKARLLKSSWASASHLRGAWSSLEANQKESLA